MRSLVVSQHVIGDEESDGISFLEPGLVWAYGSTSSPAHFPAVTKTSQELKFNKKYINTKNSIHER